MIPAILVVVAVILFCVPFAARRGKPKPRAEKEQMDAPQEEFVDDGGGGVRRHRR
jgi:hypothetical protein